MPWVLLLLAIASFLVPYFTTSFALGALCLVLALVFFVAGVMTLISSRIGENARNTAQILGPDELRALRARAEAQRQAAAQTSTATSGDQPSPPEPPVV